MAVEQIEEFTVLFGSRSVVFKAKPETMEFILKNSFPVFNEWFLNLDHTKLELRSVLFHKIFTVGSRVLFILFETEAYDRATNQKVPGIVFMRGGAIGVFTIIENSKTQEKMVCYIKQTRIPIGCYEFIECPAGMTFDQAGGIVGTAIAELEQELGVSLKSEDLEHLGKVYPSPGGCDECIDLFFTKQVLTPEKITELLEKIHGVDHEGEKIKAFLVSIPEFLAMVCSGEITDGKFLSALLLKVLRSKGGVEFFTKILAG